MNTDIRIAVNFWTHPKTGKLVKLTGLEGVRSLQILWAWVANNKPDGILSDMDPDDIEFAADWRGNTGQFFDAIIGKWIDVEEGVFCVHDWIEHNPWVAESKERSEENRFIRLSKENSKVYNELKGIGIKGITKEQYQEYKRCTSVLPPCDERTTKRTTPVPVPVPVPTLKDSREAVQTEGAASPEEILFPTTIDPKFSVSDELRKWAEEEGITVNLDSETKLFVNRSISDGKMLMNWTAAWKNWILKGEEFATKEKTRNKSPARRSRPEAMSLKEKQARELLGVQDEA